jgi:probable rRNA maturation factor
MTEKQKWNVEFEVQVASLPADIAKLRTLVETVMRCYRERQATITITIVDDAEMKKVHKQFLHKDTTTDVLSFDLTDEFEKRRVFELVVNVEMAARQALKRGHSSEAELALYITHGLLHNLGFDDDTPEHAQRMHHTEDAILDKLGFGSVYFDNESDN